MSNIQVGQVRGVEQLLQRDLSTAEIQRRIALHTSDSMERVTSVKTDSGRLELPVADSDQESALRSVYQNATPQQQAQLAQASHQLAGQIFAEIGSNVETTGVSAGMQASVGRAMETWIVSGGQAQNTDGLMQGAMFMAMDGVDAELYDMAGRVQLTVSNTRAIREDIAEFRNELVDWPDDGSTRDFSYTTYDQFGNPIEHNESLNKEQAQAKMEELEQHMATLGDDKQMFNLQLQDILQKKQQFMQTLSNMLKNMHDTAKAIINNMKA